MARGKVGMGELALSALAGKRIYVTGDCCLDELADGAVVRRASGEDFDTMRRNLDALLAADLLVVAPGTADMPEVAVDIITALGAGITVLTLAEAIALAQP